MNLFSPDVQYYWTYWTITGHLLDILDITGHTGQYWTLLDNTGRGKPAQRSPKGHLEVISGIFPI